MLSLTLSNFKNSYRILGPKYLNEYPIILVNDKLKLHQLNLSRITPHLLDLYLNLFKDSGCKVRKYVYQAYFYSSIEHRYGLKGSAEHATVSSFLKNLVLQEGK